MNFIVLNDKFDNNVNISSMKQRSRNVKNKLARGNAGTGNVGNGFFSTTN